MIIINSKKCRLEFLRCLQKTGDSFLFQIIIEEQLTLRKSSKKYKRRNMAGRSAISSYDSQSFPFTSRWNRYKFLHFAPTQGGRKRSAQKMRGQGWVAISCILFALLASSSPFPASRLPFLFHLRTSPLHAFTFHFSLFLLPSFRHITPVFYCFNKNKSLKSNLSILNWEHVVEYAVRLIRLEK